MDIENTKKDLLWNTFRRILPDLIVDDSKPAGSHQSIIRRHYNQLLSTLSVPDVVTHMFQSGKFTAKEHEHLRQFHSTPIRASEELLNIIISRDVGLYECFLESLKKTKQHHIYQMLTSGGDSVCMGNQLMFEHSRIFRQNYDWLLENLNTDSGLLSILYGKEVLSQREYGQVAFEKDRFVKNEMLLSIISRKSVEDFNTFKIALTDTLQEHLTKRLTEPPVGDANKNETATVEKTSQVICSDSRVKRTPPKPSPKSKKQSNASPTSKSMIIKTEPSLHLSKPNRTEKLRGFKIRGMAMTRVAELPNELQVDVSAKISLIHQRNSKDIILKITFQTILEESRNITRQNLMESNVVMQAIAAHENYERLTQEIVQQERDYKIIKEHIQLENNTLKMQLTEMKQRAYELQKRLYLTQNQNKNLVEKLRIHEIKLLEAETLLKKTIARKDEALKQTETALEETQEMMKETDIRKNEFEVKLIEAEKCIDDLRVLNEREKQEVRVKVFIIEQIEEQLKQTREQLMIRDRNLNENELALEISTTKLENIIGKLREAESKLKEYEAKLNDKGRDHLRLEGHLQNEYKPDPLFVQTIVPKAGKKRKSICGLAIIDKEMFIAIDECPVVEVYDVLNLSFNHRWRLKELIDPNHMVSCNRNKCLYIIDYKVRDQSKEILRVDPNGKLIKRWSTGYDIGWGLSVTYESNIIFAVFNEHKLNEYSPDGQLIREIYLSPDAGIHHPMHGTKLSNGHFVICHGYGEDDLHRVCIVDADGKLKKSFGGKCGPDNSQTNTPTHLSVFENRLSLVIVADRWNSRVLFLDENLEFKREIILSKKDKDGLRYPRRILLDEPHGRVLVADNGWDSKKKISIDGRILIFNFI